MLSYVFLRFLTFSYVFLRFLRFLTFIRRMNDYNTTNYEYLSRIDYVRSSDFGTII